MARAPKNPAVRAERAKEIAGDWLDTLRGDTAPTADAPTAPINADDDTLSLEEIDALHKADAERRVETLKAEVTARAQVDDTTEPVVALVKAVDRPDREQKYADLRQIVRGAETLRFDAQTTYELERQLDAASDLLALARAQEANGEHVNVEILRGLRERNDRYSNQLEGWLAQRGVKNDGGGS